MNFDFVSTEAITTLVFKDNSAPIHRLRRHGCTASFSHFTNLALGEMVKASSTVSRDIRKDDYGKLEGYWSTEIGPLNQVMHLWSYADFNERARLHGELAKNPRWTDENIPLIVRQDARLLKVVRAPVPPATTGRLERARQGACQRP
ncbi:NIPSNAP family protein [Bradyrhizobium sediminis]|uniref:NIPSNAP family protein n=1 Tax=Bradyrhizobium sediminis TaxID=2840469 RepID=UPI00201BBA27|nr:NIPSNAP family protein [Bradyrhizobium sediminis]